MEAAPGLVRDSWVIFSRIPCHCLLSSCVPGSFLIVTENGPARENCSSSCRLGYFLWTRAQSWDCWVTGRDRGSGFSLCVSGSLGREVIHPLLSLVEQVLNERLLYTGEFGASVGGYRLSLRGTLKTRLGANGEC